MTGLGPVYVGRRRREEPARAAPALACPGSPEDPQLPHPPPSGDYYQYFRMARRRGLVIVMQLAALGVLWGLWAVFSKSPYWWPLLAVLLVAVPWRVFSILQAARAPLVTLQSHAAVLSGGWRCAAEPVDVFLPVAGESPEILRNTFSYVARLTWDGPLRVYVLDDGADPAVRELARDHGFTYSARVSQEWRKAGNLNSGLAISGGRYIAVLDADFAPSAGFLTETVPYMLDPGTGIIQTAQFFATGRRDTRNWLQRFTGSAESSFYIWSQPARQSDGAAFCVGTSAVYRREALDAIGGFPAVQFGEDVITTLRLLARGYRTVYVPLTVSAGACPETFGAVVNQQYRWCATALGHWASRANGDQARRAYRDAPLTRRQRILYSGAALHYMQSLSEVVMSGPSMIMLWAYPWQIQPGNYIPIAPALLSMAIAPGVIKGWRPGLIRLQVIYTASHLTAVIDVLRGRVAGWVTSGSAGHKGRVPLQAGIIARIWVAVTLGLSWWAVSRDLPVYGLGSFWAAILVTAVQSVLLAPLLLPRYGIRSRQ